MAGEGRRLYGRTTTSAVPNKYAMTVRHPLGVAGLIIAANTPIANVAWKVFPALICGNTAVLKAAEDTPATAWFFGQLALEAGLPPGVLNIVQGLGEEAGAPLVAHPDIAVISFTGSTEVGRQIAEIAGVPRGARQVGYALKTLPAGHRLPWHRDVRSSGHIALDPDSDGFREQRDRLRAEGVRVEAGRIDMRRFRWRPDLDELLWAPSFDPGTD